MSQPFKPLMTTLATALAVALPALAQARPVTMSIPLKNYGGDGAYLAVYLTDAKGAYVRTLWVADGKRLQGVTGASVGAGRTLKVTADLADALIEAGYEIRVDAAAEDMRDSSSEVRVPLNAANAGKPHAGKQYIQSLTYQLP